MWVLGPMNKTGRAMTQKELRAYRSGWQQGIRRAMYLQMISPLASPLARQCMINELARYGKEKRISTRFNRKPPRWLGNEGWEALGNGNQDHEGR